jgi:hypothetical protein
MRAETLFDHYYTYQHESEEPLHPEEGDSNFFRNFDNKSRVPEIKDTLIMFTGSHYTYLAITV